jgi:hypothetical protein
MKVAASAMAAFHSGVASVLSASSRLSNHLADPKEGWFGVPLGALDAVVLYVALHARDLSNQGPMDVFPVAEDVGSVSTGAGLHHRHAFDHGGLRLLVCRRSSGRVSRSLRAILSGG